MDHKIPDLPETRTLAIEGDVTKENILQQPAGIGSGNPALDFTSELFDPDKALNTEGVEPPYPHMAPLDNVAKCLTLLPQDNLMVQRTAEDRQAAIEKHLGLKQKAVTGVQRIKASVTVSLQKVFDYVKPGPLQLLRTWYTSKTVIRVVTRHAYGVRGVATGTLECYDRFMNLVLHDVQETYTVIVKVPKVKHVTKYKTSRTSADVDPVEAGETGEVFETAERVRWVRKQEWRSRQLGRIFVKGDNIVAVSPADQYQAAVPTG